MKTHPIRFLIFALCCLHLILFGQNFGVPWPAVDGLQRKLSAPKEVHVPSKTRTVGIFYFLWHEQNRRPNPDGTGPYDIMKIVEKDPEALSNPNSPHWGSNGVYHYWGEPLFGYYTSDDPWVIRRHAQLLSDAGIDVLIFDTTNAVIYQEAFINLCRVFTQARMEGVNTPRICFMLNTSAGDTAQRIYRALYQQGLYRELWFVWESKPLMICDPEKVDAEIRDFFTLRKAHWPFEMINTPYAWHWEATYPQPYGYTADPEVPEMVNVSVAQNLRRSDGKVTNMSDGNARGRSFWKNQLEPAPATDLGRNFHEQWQRAFELDPPFVMVTGWNEWIAGRWKRGDEFVFVDQFDREYSRDIEPMKGGHGDHYYMQLVEGVRNYKGAPPLPEAPEMLSINLDGPWSQWNTVLPEFRDSIGEVRPRNHPGAAGTFYKNDSGRNDLVISKASWDREFLYFYLKTVEPLQPSIQPDGLWLLLDTDQDLSNGWLGGDYLVGGKSTDKQVSLEKHRGEGWEWEAIGWIDYRMEGNQIHFAIPIDYLNSSDRPVSLKNTAFKWMDNIQSPTDPLDIYISGDVAPESRFFHQFSR